MPGTRGANEFAPTDAEIITSMFLYAASFYWVLEHGDGNGSWQSGKKVLPMILNYINRRS
jgi:hypothetical protein